MAELIDLYKIMKEAEDNATKIRAEIKEKMQLKRAAAPRGYTRAIIDKCPKYNTVYGHPKLNLALRGANLDPDVLAALDEIVPDEVIQHKGSH